VLDIFGKRRRQLEKDLQESSYKIQELSSQFQNASYKIQELSSQLQNALSNAQDFYSKMEESSIKVKELSSLKKEYSLRSIEVGKLYKQKVSKLNSIEFADTFKRYPKDWLEFSELGCPGTYRPTYSFTNEYINENHKFYATCPTGRYNIDVCIDIGIDGFIQHAEALKIYELAYYAEGNILELGTHKGLSATIICQALNDAQKNVNFNTVDIDAVANVTAVKNLSGVPGGLKVKFNLMDATQFLNREINNNEKYSFIFVDHHHGYQATFEAASCAKELLTSGGFILFHDFNDRDNCDYQHHYGVYQAVTDKIIGDIDFEFYGIFGSCSLFRKM